VSCPAPCDLVQRIAILRKKHWSVKRIVIIVVIDNNYRYVRYAAANRQHRGTLAMEFVQLETFLAVATYGGFHRAAAALRISQPAVSARIHALEESLGTRLFERGPSGFSLSLAGKTLRTHAEQLLRQVAWLARLCMS
jgi:hypothetical protein